MGPGLTTPQGIVRGGLTLLQDRCCMSGVNLLLDRQLFFFIPSSFSNVCGQSACF